MGNVKNNMTAARLKEVTAKIELLTNENELYKAEKRALEAKLLLPKITEKYLGKYFVRPELFNKKEKMFIHVREIVSSYEYRGVKVMIYSSGTIEVNPNYLGNISSIGKEVGKTEWVNAVERASDVIDKI
jgi:hypothetical protein